MAKAKSVFVCNECGYESAKWLGRCPACNEWNSFFEQKILDDNKMKARGSRNGNGMIQTKPLKLNDVVGKCEARISTGVSELDRVLGGGLVKGSLVLLGGEPGIGKSTLILQICDKVRGRWVCTIYIWRRVS